MCIRDRFGGKRVLGRKTVEYMLSNQLAPGVVNLIGNADPTSADLGFGLGLSVRTTPGIVRRTGSVGEVSWNGAYAPAGGPTRRSSSQSSSWRRRRARRAGTTAT